MPLILRFGKSKKETISYSRSECWLSSDHFRFRAIWDFGVPIACCVIMMLNVRKQME